jgi:uncharacterized repeat protein (TIGR01451 family)
LTRIELQVNSLTGPIPSLKDLTGLDALYLYQNELDGSIPEDLCQLTNLRFMDLDINNLTGSIPDCLEDLDNLYRLGLSQNQLTGPIPGELGNMDSLEWLILRDNQLDGSIPENLRNLAILEGLDLSKNQLTGNIPSWLDELTNLKDLELNDNQLDGSIPSELGSLQNLYELDLSGNQLTGNIPGSLGSLSGLLYLELDNNKLSGAIPSALGSATELRRLYLNGNALSGEIPTSLANLTNISGGYLDIGYNALYTEDIDLLVFLENSDWNWEQTQTIAPEGVAATTLTATSVEVSYTPIEYDSDPGGYVVFYGKAPGGPYPLSMTTANKEVAEAEVTGLDPGETYYFRVKTRTDPHPDNEKNTLFSEFTDEVSAETPIWADMSVTKTGDPGPVTANEQLTYTITVQNLGPSVAVKARLIDNLPSELKSAEYSTDGGTNWQFPWPGLFPFGDMAPGTYQILIRGTVAPSAFEIISNTANVATQTQDPDPGNNSATVETTVEAAADLLVTKTGSPDPVTAGEALTYTITVQNQGPSDAVNTTLTDTVPTDLQSPEYSADGGQTWGSWTGSLPLGTLTASGSQQVLIRGTVAPSFSGTLSNTAGASADTIDPVSENDSATAETTVEGWADLAVTKADDGYDPTLAGNSMTYTITVQNQGPSNAVDVTLSDTVPPQMLSPEYSLDGGVNWDPWTGSLPLGTMSPGSSEEVLIRSKIDPLTTGTISNTATVSSNTDDPVAGNNSATEETTIEAKADLGVTKEDSTDPILSGHQLTYTITVENSGPSDASNVQLTDNVPSELDSPQYSTNGGQTWGDWSSPLNLGTVGADASQQVLIRGTLVPSANGTISNTVSVSSETPDDKSENNSATETTRVVVKGDMNGDGQVDLRDAIFVSKILCGLVPDYTPSHILIDLDGDGKISWGELLWILQTISEQRQ